MSVRPIHTLKCSETWQLEQWAKWPLESSWPGMLDLYEAAAFLRVHPDTIRNSCQVARRDGKARLAHQRIGASYRISKKSLQTFGSVEQRSVA